VLQDVGGLAAAGLGGVALDQALQLASQCSTVTGQVTSVSRFIIAARVPSGS
jgi:hypothetical protein